MRVDAFRPAEEFKSHMDQWIERFRNARPSEGNEKVLIPGDPEREMEAIRIKEGIPLVEIVEKDLHEIATKFGLKL
jgi:LDH2 family malate/lactate/ureidoglycolate dehydrogenase